MNHPESAVRSNVVSLQERRLGRTVLRTYRSKLNVEDVVQNDRQPRLGPKIDEELQGQIEANEGLFEPLLVEPHPDLPNKFRIIDGDRRWTNSMELVQRLSPSMMRNLFGKSGCGSTNNGSNRPSFASICPWSSSSIFGPSRGCLSFCTTSSTFNFER